MPTPDPETVVILEKAKEVAEAVLERVCSMLDDANGGANPVNVTADQWYEWQQTELASDFLIFGKIELLEQNGQIVVT